MANSVTCGKWKCEYVSGDANASVECDSNDGKFKFTAGASDTVFKITYTDGDNTSSVEYTLKKADADKCIICDCGTERFEAKGVTTTIPAAGGSKKIGTYEIKHDACKDKTIGFKNLVYVSDVTASNNNINGTVAQNLGPERDISYTVTFNGKECTTITVHQAGGCGCDNYGFNIGPTITYFEEPTKTVTLGTATTNSDVCDFSLIDFTSNTISNLSLNRSTGVLTGIVSKNPNEDPQYLSFSMVFGENKEHCTGKDYTITVLGEDRYCLVDNCADDDYDTSTRPNLHQLKGAGSGSSASETGCDSCHPAMQYKPYIKIGEVQYYTVTKTIPDETSDIFLFQPTGGTWTSTGNWLSAEVTDSCYWGDCAGGQPGTGFGIEYNISPNNGSTKNQVRWARVRVYWDLSTTAGANAWNEARTCGTGGRPSGWHFKKDSWVYIMQAPQGKKFSDKKPDAPNKCSTMRDDIERHIYRIVDENYECQS